MMERNERDDHKQKQSAQCNVEHHSPTFDPKSLKQNRLPVTVPNSKFVPPLQPEPKVTTRGNHPDTARPDPAGSGGSTGLLRAIQRERLDDLLTRAARAGLQVLHRVECRLVPGM